MDHRGEEQARGFCGATQHMLGPQIVKTQVDTASTRTDIQALHYLKDKPGETLTLWAVYLTNYRQFYGERNISSDELVKRSARTQTEK